MAAAMMSHGLEGSAFAAPSAQEITPQSYGSGKKTGAAADEPIVGLWQVTWVDADTHDVVPKVWDVWHADGTEIQNDTTPILLGNVCVGAWVPLGHRTYGLTHPAFNFLGAPENQEGQPDPNTSVLVLERVTVSKDGNSFEGPGIYKTVAGTDPLDPSANVLSSQKLIITGKRVQVDKSQLP
jgi:hypothetical protein